MKLTENEIAALEICLNYNSREGQLSDNYSNGGPAEFAHIFDGNMQAVGGLIASLEKKGLAWSDDEDPNMVWLTDKGVNVIFDHKEGKS